MSLNLYRRHFRIPGKCVAGHDADSHNYEPEELRRGWKKCHCPIYADGTLAGVFKRRNTKKAIWPDAKAIVAAWEQVGVWDETDRIPTIVAAPFEQEPSTRPKITIPVATEAFLSNRSGREIVSGAPANRMPFTDA